MRSHAIPCRIAHLLLRWHALRGVALGLLLLSHVTPALVDASPTFVYVAAQNRVCQYQLNLQTGALTSLTPQCVTVGKSPMTLVFHPSQRYFYAVNRGNPDTSITRFVRDPVSGQVTEQETIRAQLLTGSMVVCPTGRHAYNLSNGASADLPGVADNSIWTWNIHPDTAALTLVGTDSAGVSGVSGLDVDTSCTSLYVTGQHSENLNLAQFSFNPQTGRPVRLNPPTVSAGIYSGPLSPRLDADGQFLYAANSYAVQGFGWSVAQFSRNPETGRLTPLNPLLVQTTQNPTAMYIDPSNEFVRVLTYNDSISSYRKDDRTGELRPLNPPTVQTGRNPWAMAIDYSNTFGFVATRSSANVWRYRIKDQTGQLEVLDPPLTPAPGWLPTNVIITDPHVPQAEQDMLERAAKDPHFRSPRYGTFARLPEDERHEWEIRLMYFTAAVGQDLRTVPIVHAINKANPALRFIQYEDPVTEKWTGWEQVSAR